MIIDTLGLIIIGISIVSCVVCWLYGILDRYADKVFDGLRLNYPRCSFVILNELLKSMYPAECIDKLRYWNKNNDNH